jgi:hypothetical protein
MAKQRLCELEIQANLASGARNSQSKDPEKFAKLQYPVVPLAIEKAVVVFARWAFG